MENRGDHFPGFTIGDKVDVLDVGKWWQGTLKGIFQLDKQPVYMVKCSGYPAEVTSSISIC